MPPDTSKGADGRLLCLDAVRGAAVAAMIMANAQGNPFGCVLLQHMPWHGCTPIDLGFPFFVFVMGATIPLTTAKRRDQGCQDKDLVWRIAKRTLILFAMGLPGGISIDAGGYWRIPGVLQRIALCYAPAALAHLRARGRMLMGAAAGLLVGYWLLMTRYPVPGYGAGVLTPAGNLASYLDRRLLGHHMMNAVYDAEGILSTLPAIATTLLGVIAGRWLVSERPASSKAAGLIVGGFLIAAAGLAWHPYFPLNKHIWTSSFALFGGGLASCVMGAVYWIADIRRARGWVMPLQVFGANALLAFCTSNLADALIDLWNMPLPDGTPGTLRLYLCARFFESWMDRTWASEAFGFCFMLVFFAIFWVLYRRRIFLSI
jgi:predicted acyltransferase